jgi:hypothetical protein
MNATAEKKISPGSLIWIFSKQILFLIFQVAQQTSADPNMYIASPPPTPQSRGDPDPELRVAIWPIRLMETQGNQAPHYFSHRTSEKHMVNIFRVISHITV